MIERRYAQLRTSSSASPIACTSGTAAASSSGQMCQRLGGFGSNVGRRVA